MTAKQVIMSYLEGLDWTHAGQVESLGVDWGIKPSTVSRRLRELYEDGQLDRKLVKGCVWYKKRPSTLSPMYAQPNSLSLTGHIKPNQLFETPPKTFKMEG